MALVGAPASHPLWKNLLSSCILRDVLICLSPAPEKRLLDTSAVLRSPALVLASNSPLQSCTLPVLQIFLWLLPSKECLGLCSLLEVGLGSRLSALSWFLYFYTMYRFFLTCHWRRRVRLFSLVAAPSFGLIWVLSLDSCKFQNVQTRPRRTIEGGVLRPSASHGRFLLIPVLVNICIFVSHSSLQSARRGLWPCRAVYSHLRYTKGCGDSYLPCPWERHALALLL